MEKKWVIGVSTPFEYLTDEHFAEYREVGIGAFELSVDAEYYMNVDFKAVEKIAQKNGITPWSFHLPFYYLPNVIISVLDEEAREKTVRFQSEQIRKSAAAGFKHVVVHPSSEPIVDSERAKYFNASRKSIEALSKVCEEEGVKLAVENLPRTCIANTARELLELIQGLDGVGICFDVNHLLSENHDEFLSAIAHKLVTVHLSDYDRVDERHWLPGEGVIDWTALIKGFEKFGYNGPLMYEINRGATDTIHRDRVVGPKDFVKNANELIEGLEITKLGKVLV